MKTILRFAPQASSTMTIEEREALRKITNEPYHVHWVPDTYTMEQLVMSAIKADAEIILVDSPINLKELSELVDMAHKVNTTVIRAARVNSWMTFSHYEEVLEIKVKTQALTAPLVLVS